MTDRNEIGNLVQAAAYPVESLRYYEREGLLPALPRSHGNELLPGYCIK